ncbi:MAG: stalk domain-containing protein [Bacillota bacterium]
MTRRLIGSMILMVLFVLSIATPAQGTEGTAQPEPIQVYVNGQPLTLDVPPALVNGRTLVPLRAIFEALNAEVTWDQASQTALAKWQGGEMELTIGAASARVNGDEKRLDVPGQLIDNRTMVPLRFVAEAMGAQVGWYGQNRLITINRPAAPLTPATVIEAEAEWTPFGIYVVAVVRLADGNTQTLYLEGVEGYGLGHGIDPFVKERLLGQDVKVELARSEPTANGRYVAYLYLDDGSMFNVVLLDEGYVKADPNLPEHRYAGLFTALSGKKCRVMSWQKEQDGSLLSTGIVLADCSEAVMVPVLLEQEDGSKSLVAIRERPASYATKCWYRLTFDPSDPYGHCVYPQAVFADVIHTEVEIITPADTQQP